ncbi:retrotransposon protein, putative, ty1-copia subclass [Tanacetum coccineum]|uniref:Retrotransposon protein, putative, ty1-copia subclass n=1 Tax=Tanacetum coccineum TaxID=301880 RepID=A0ABQ5B0L0_9ASTR
MKEIGKSSRTDDKVVQDQRQRDDYDLRDERQDQPKEEEVEPRRRKRARTEISFGPDLFLLCYKWIFKKKRKADGTVDKYKARLVIKGFRQREGLDYFDTYSLVTRITSIRMILAIAALRNLEVHQIDVKKAFLNRDLKEEIYMNQPKGFMAPRLESKVCRLVKSLYDLRKAPKQGHQISPYHETKCISQGKVQRVTPTYPMQDGTDIKEKDEKQSQNDKTEHGMEKLEKDKVKSKPKLMKSRRSQSQPRDMVLERESKTEPENLNF